MCNYQKLAKNSDGVILWCNDCHVYSLQFNNIVMTLNETGFQQFKENIENCYQEDHSCSKHAHHKHIIFETKLVGMKLCFSKRDVGSLLALMQEATFSYYDYSCAE